MTNTASPSPLLVVTNHVHDRHDTGDHPESSPRLNAALHGLGLAGLGEAFHDVASRAATFEEIAAVHDPAYINRLEALCARGGGPLDQDTPVVEGSWHTALHSAGAGLLAVESLAQGAASAGLVVTRPPGHHAGPKTGMGFCLFNNVAITARQLTSNGERVMIIDWDVHHGNGTQDVFWDDDRVLFVSLHQYPYYPGTGAVHETGGPNASGNTINVPLPPGTTGDVFLSAFDTLIAPAAAEFSPTWVLVSAGFDAHRDDPLADLSLTAGDFADLAKRTQGLVSQPGRLVLFLEGGYDLRALSMSVGACAAALCDTSYRPEPASNGGMGASGVRAAIEAHRLARW